MQSSISFSSFRRAKVSLIVLIKVLLSLLLAPFVIFLSVESEGKVIRTPTAVPNYCEQHGAINSKITTGNFLFLRIFRSNFFWRKVSCKKCAHSDKVWKIGEYPSK